MESTSSESSGVETPHENEYFVSEDTFNHIAEVDENALDEGQHEGTVTPEHVEQQPLLGVQPEESSREESVEAATNNAAPTTSTTAGAAPRQSSTPRQPVIGLSADAFIDYLNQHHAASFEQVTDMAKLIRSRYEALPQEEMRATKQPTLVIDAEHCLQRLYGGYTSDWMCGGQWTHMVNHLRMLLAPFQMHGIVVLVVVDGTAHQPPRHAAWRVQQVSYMEATRVAYKNVRMRRQLPPRHIWLSPPSLRQALLMALRKLDVRTAVSVNDHKQEVMSLVRERRAIALMAGGGEYILMQAPLLIGIHLRTSPFKARVECRAVNAEIVEKTIDLPSNALLRVSQLRGLYATIMHNEDSNVSSSSASATESPQAREKGILSKERRTELFDACIAYCRQLTPIDDLEALSTTVASQARIEDENERREFAATFKTSVEYYRNATQEYFHKYFQPMAREAVLQRAFIVEPKATGATETHEMASDAQHEAAEQLATATTEPFVEATADVVKALSVEETTPAQEELQTPPPTPAETATDATAPSHGAIEATVAAATTSTMSSEPAESTRCRVSSRVLEVAYRRVARALMHPWILHILVNQELRLSACPDDMPTGTHLNLQMLPCGWQQWRHVRQRIYAVLFDLHHKQYMNRQRQQKEAEKDKQSCRQSTDTATCSTRIVVNEWIGMPKTNQWQTPVEVVAQPLPHLRSLPTLHSLWFRDECSEKRLRAFLACFDADNNPLLVQQVPRACLLPCCVLRSMLTAAPMCASDGSVQQSSMPRTPLLQAAELDAFLVTAVTVGTMNAELLSEQPIELSHRGAHLAQLFMQGVEHAIVANDACGAPLPWMICAPWMYFDGKIFQGKLHALTRQGLSVAQLCHGNMALISQIERMRMAVIHAIDNAPSYPSLPLMRPIAPQAAVAAARNVQLALQLLQQQQPGGRNSRQRVNPATLAANALAIQQALTTAQLFTQQQQQMMRMPVPQVTVRLPPPPPPPQAPTRQETNSGTGTLQRTKEMPDMTGVVHVVANDGNRAPPNMMTHGSAPVYMQQNRPMMTHQPPPMSVQAMHHSTMYCQPSCSAAPTQQQQQVQQQTPMKPIFTANLTNIVQQQPGQHVSAGFGQPAQSSTMHQPMHVQHPEGQNMQYIGYNGSTYTSTCPPPNNLVNGAQPSMPQENATHGTYAAAVGGTYQTPYSTIDRNVPATPR